jgi:hypothetical protein
MKQAIDWLHNNVLRRVIAVLLVTFMILIISAFSYSASMQAHAVTSPPQQKESDPATRDMVKRLQQKAEDFGDSPDRPIGQTGLENIKELGKKIPETIDLNIRQKGAIYNPDEPNTMKAMEKAQREVERAAQ